MEVLCRMREMREEKGISQGKLADLLYVSRQTINAIETGKYNPSLELALQIAHFFDTTVEDIFTLVTDERRF
ncbi:helix-turn-helix transcriptional regulator [Breznakia pachnodae]|uniref:Transcriptional regulator n=1 Tax=Breznakia pachnodae TaxID=265178 RepID=A0ABU0E5D3_9FIRM|nr:helix-turn-helix transcriptional regulator [Breznakia pachnodae]MDQ0362112.1 putative transcriptional regulator [Breznakia pachnodae]